MLLATIDALIGKTFSSVTTYETKELIFRAETGEVYQFYHEQDCCESVNIDDIVGDLSDLEWSPMLIARQDSDITGTNERGGASLYYPESYTWTFYNFATAKGYVTVKWYGSSNGYYSESVEFTQIK